ncbi:hypothetical protein SLS62_003403 [Diatrype stigma]|uniref:5'-3' DNA helicase ZGRF1-like N-terminal domain-containing protein n=1 Tax=Diatrype stigma TaxID=117547 RepID=A0AAN9USV9_9PEZI
MAAAVHAMQSSAASSSTTLRAASTTAPVLEFVCLFTHDLRRKQKRWQDGRLKYHTFNKRVMVYDERGNFAGDGHWREDFPLCDGEELQLERGGIIVQVAECTGTREQDLSELVDKRAQEKAQRQSAALARRHPTLEPPTPQSAVVTAAHFEPRHRPLHQLIGTPTGHHGRALIPSESPYQQRQQQLEASPNQDDPNRPAKRRKRDISPPSKSGYAQSLFGTTLTLSGCPMSSAPLRRRPVGTPLTRRGDPCPTSSDRSNRDSDMEPAPLAPKPAAAIEQRGAVSAGSRSSTNMRQRVLASPSRKNVETRRDSSPIIIEDAPEQCQLPDNAQGHTSTSPKARKDSRVSGKKKRNHLQPAPVNENQVLASDAKRTSDGDNPKDSPLDNDYAKRVIKWREERRRAAEISQPGLRRGANADPALHTEKVSTNVKSASRPSKEIDATEMTEKGTDGRVPANEPTTELRIRPRKKPGLLMLSDKTSVTEPNRKRRSNATKNIPVDIAAPEPLKEIDSNKRRSKFMISENYELQALDSKDRSKHNIRTQRHETARQNAVLVEEVEEATEIDINELNPSEGEFTRNTARGLRQTRHRASETSSKSLRSTGVGAVASGDEAIEEMEGSPPFKRSRKKHPKTAVEDRDDISPEILESRSRRSKRKTRSDTTGTNNRLEEPDSSPHSDQEEDKLSEEDPTPRLAKIKNGIRTREIIGFVFDDEDDEEDCGETNVTADDKPNELHHPPENLPAQERAAPDAAVLQDFKATAPPQMTIQPSSRQNDTLPHVADDIQLENSSGKADGQSSGCPMDQVTAAALPKDILSQGHGVGSDTSPAEPQLPLTRPQGSEYLTKPSLADELGAHQDILRDADPTIRQPPCISDNVQRQDKPAQDVPDLGGNVQRAASTELEATLSKAAVAKRTINPASRGKKAAKPSDAAGQLPQCPLPPEARSIGVPRPMNGNRVGEARKQDKGVATPLPGFAKANGGPWSREAFDLFEFKRPT